ncbi:Uncharacterised protein [Mycobacterium tuberculosis]|nr:Uncharacterised protein [Mycobacterium tuberculosis]
MPGRFIYEDPDHLPIIDLAQCPLIVNGARQLDRLGEVGLSGFRVATTAAATCDERSSQHCAVACVACQRQGMVSLRDDVGGAHRARGRPSLEYYLLRKRPRPNPRRHKMIVAFPLEDGFEPGQPFAHAPLRPQRLQCGCELQCGCNIAVSTAPGECGTQIIDFGFSLQEALFIVGGGGNVQPCRHGCVVGPVPSAHPVDFFGFVQFF